MSQITEVVEKCCATSISSCESFYTGNRVIEGKGLSTMCSPSLAANLSEEEAGGKSCPVSVKEAFREGALVSASAALSSGEFLHRGLLSFLSFVLTSLLCLPILPGFTSKKESIFVLSM